MESIFLLDNSLIIFATEELISDYKIFYEPTSIEIISNEEKFLKLKNVLNEKIISDSKNILETILIPLEAISNKIQYVNFDLINDINLIGTFSETSYYYLLYNCIKQTAKIVKFNQFNDIEKLIEDFESVKLIKVYQESELKQNQFDEINSFLSVKKFHSYDEIDTKIEYIEKVFNVSQDQIYDSINDIFYRLFEITNSNKDRVKCNLVYHLFEKEMSDTPKKLLKTTINELLNNFNIKKKRFTDGYSFTGLKQKQMDINLLQKQREKDLENMLSVQFY